MNDRLDSQHIVMPVGEEQDDTTVLMLQGAYRGDFFFKFYNINFILNKGNFLSFFFSYLQFLNKQTGQTLTLLTILAILLYLQNNIFTTVLTYRGDLCFSSDH